MLLPAKSFINLDLRQNFRSYHLRISANNFFFQNRQVSFFFLLKKRFEIMMIQVAYIYPMATFISSALLLCTGLANLVHFEVGTLKSPPEPLAKKNSYYKILNPCSVAAVTVG